MREWLQRKDADHRDKLLACGAIIVAELRLQVLRETEFTCSAGVAHNKVLFHSFFIYLFTFWQPREILKLHHTYIGGILQMLAKLASGMNKPAQQTIVTSASVKELLETLPVKKM